MSSSYTFTVEATTPGPITITSGDSYELSVTTTSYEFTVQTTGAQGPAGTDATYRHIQSVAAATWTVTHNLGKRPAVTVTDSSGRVVLGDVRYLSTDAVEVSFSAAFAGEAICN
jgi:hypothetical protein